jgi:hypothetical protein
VKYTQYGICNQAALKNARAMFFLFSGGTDSYFWAGLKNIRAGEMFLQEGCPARIWNPYKFVKKAEISCNRPQGELARPLGVK